MVNLLDYSFCKEFCKGIGLVLNIRYTYIARISKKNNNLKKIRNRSTDFELKSTATFNSIIKIILFKFKSILQN
jgi:hypothetical protein